MDDKQPNNQKIEEVVRGNYRKPGQPVDFSKLIDIAEKLDALEAKNPSNYPQHGY